MSQISVSQRRSREGLFSGGRKDSYRYYLCSYCFAEVSNVVTSVQPIVKLLC